MSLFNDKLTFDFYKKNRIKRFDNILYLAIDNKSNYRFSPR
jgi:hypothetical protein